MPTETLEVVGNTRKLSSEKGGVDASTTCRMAITSKKLAETWCPETNKITHVDHPRLHHTTECTLLRIEGKVMKQALYDGRKFSEKFVGHLLSRNIRYEEDLVDQLFNSSEKRLARILLLMARFGNDGLSATTDVGEINVVLHD